MTISDSEILNLVRAEAANTIGTSDSDSQLGQDRSKSIDYYHGKMTDAPHEAGWSGVTTRDAFLTVESALPDIIEIFESTEDIMEFRPESEEDVDKARQETDVVNSIYNVDNPGFINTYTYFKDALMVKNGFMMASWVDSEEDTEEHYFEQSDEDLALLEAEEDIEVIETETETKTIELGEGLPDVQVKTHMVITKRTKDTSKVVVQALPPEEVAVSRDTIDLQKTALVRHEPKTTTRSDLLEMGIDADKVGQLRRVDEQDSEEEIARDTLDQDDIRDSSTNTPMQKVDIANNYIRMDARGNGRAELWQVMTGNDDSILLFKTRLSRVPISTLTPTLEPHQLFGISLIDQVMDLQRITTFFTRAAIDNAAALNNQRPITNIEQLADSTLDDILTNSPSSPILVKGDARSALQYAPNNIIAGDMIGLIGYFDKVREERTGIQRSGQAMDPDAISKDVTATEFAGQRADALKAIKLIARIFAETGMKDVMINIHHAAQAHSGNKKRSFRLNGKFVQVNPREWKTRSDMTVNVGLGTGTKAEQITQLGNILVQQKEAYALQGNVDVPGGLVTLSQIRHTMGRIIELMGFKDADAFFNEIDDEQQAARTEEAANEDAPQDPAILKIQTDAANDAEKNQIEREKNIMNAQIEQSDNDLDRQVKIFQIVQELQLKAEGQDAEIELNTAALALKTQLENDKLDLAAETTGTQMGIDAAKGLEDLSLDVTPTVRVGGDIAG